MEDDDDEFEGHMQIAPQRFSRVTLIRAGLDFLSHVAEGAACALRQLENAVIGHELRVYEERAFHEEMAWDLESIPDTEEG